MSNYAVVVVDMQKVYFQAGDLRDQAPGLVLAINEVIERAHGSNVPVFTVVTRHERDRSTWTLNMQDDQEGYLFADEEGSEIVEGLKVRSSTIVVKTRDSAFIDTTLAMQLRMLEIDTIILLGVSTHSCIYQTASDAYAHNFRVLIASDAVASHDKRWHGSALRILEQEYRQPTVSNGEIKNLLSQLDFRESS